MRRPNQRAQKWALGVLLFGLCAGLLHLFMSASRLDDIEDGIQHNMRELQSVAKVYALEHDGYYAPDLDSLRRAAENADPPYWKDLDNPCEGGKTRYDFLLKPRYRALPAVQAPEAERHPCAVIYTGLARGLGYEIAAYNYAANPYNLPGERKPLVLRFEYPGEFPPPPESVRDYH